MSMLSLIFGSLIGMAGGFRLFPAASGRSVTMISFLSEFAAGRPTPDESSGRVATPFMPRLMRPAGARAVNMVRALLPSNYLDRVRLKIAVAGLTERVTPEEFVTVQLVSLGGGVLLGLVISLAAGWSATGVFRSTLLFGIIGPLIPLQWLQKSRQKRQAQIRRDLPDILDLLAISVEAGVGLEGAIEIVGKHFDSPLAHEMSRMLREMELGVSRRIALQNMKMRIEVQDVSNFVLALVQADALGMPIGRVLRTQAHEMRLRRRQWAREKAGKLPVKIIFPLVMFILPALFVIVLGPAVMSISHQILHHGH